MKTPLSVITWLSLCTALLAQPAATPRAAGSGAPVPPKPQMRTLDPAARSNLMARIGGMVMTPAEGPSLLFLDTQTRVPGDTAKQAAEQIQRILRLSSTAKAKPSDEPVAEAVKALADKNTAAVIVIGDSEGYPPLLVAPEGRWAMVNVAALAGEGVSAATLADRTGKEIWRALGYLMGAANSNYEHCVLKPVLAAADLDAIKSTTLCPEPFGKISTHAQKLGMKPIRATSYRKAVEEGWAPAPTNDVQRAIWSELKK